MMVELDGPVVVEIAVDSGVRLAGVVL